MKHFTEEELIAYQLHESVESDAIAGHLEHCALCAGVAESIAETLRVFSGETVPQANLEHAWQRLRGNLPPLAPVARRSAGGWWRWLAIPLVAALLAVAYAGLMQKRLGASPKTSAHLAAGPLTEQPRDAELQEHLANAERLLTELNHSPDGVDEATRGQAHDLLLSNAVYIHQARQDGDPAEVAVLENLDRTLTTLQHIAPRPAGAELAADEKGVHLRMQLNTNGLLLDLRILQQNGFESKDPERTTKGHQ